MTRQKLSEMTMFVIGLGRISIADKAYPCSPKGCGIKSHGALLSFENEEQILN